MQRCDIPRTFLTKVMCGHDTLQPLSQWSARYFCNQKILHRCSWINRMLLKEKMQD